MTTSRAKVFGRLPRVGIPAAIIVALAQTLGASAQTYTDANGTIVPGFVPIMGCPAGGGRCTGSAVASIFSGQQSTTASAVALPSQALVNGIVITAKAANGGTVYVGPSGVTASTGYPLAAGQSISYAVTNLSAIFVLDATAGDGVAFTGN